ncbi:MAG TPA: MoaD/ThiS family protein [Nitrososphaera sp.]
MSDIEEKEHHPQFIALKVKSFAILKDIIGTQQITLRLPRKQEVTTVADLRIRILELYPEISAQRIAMGIAVNAKMANDKSVINDFDEIALLPPISGG